MDLDIYINRKIAEVVHFDESRILKLTTTEFWLQEDGAGIITKFSLK